MPAGVKYPLRWVEQVQAKSTERVRWMVMVDAAAYVPTQPLDLRKVSSQVALPLSHLQFLNQR